MAGALVSASRGSGGKIWNVLCLIFLPLWIIFLSGFTSAIRVNDGLAVLGWISLVTLAAFTFATGIAAAKVTLGGLTVSEITSSWKAQFSDGNLGRKVVILLPAALVVLTIPLAFVAAVPATVAAIVNGVLVAKSIRQDIEYGEALAYRIGAAVGGELSAGSLTWGQNGSLILSPIPAGAFQVVSKLDDLHERIAEFAPEYEIAHMDSSQIVFVAAGTTAPTETPGIESPVV